MIRPAPRTTPEAVLICIGLVFVGLLLAAAIMTATGCGKGPTTIPPRPTPVAEGHCDDNDWPPCPGGMPCVNNRCPPPPVPPGGAP